MQVWRNIIGRRGCRNFKEETNYFCRQIAYYKFYVHFMLARVLPIQFRDFYFFLFYFAISILPIQFRDFYSSNSISQFLFLPIQFRDFYSSNSIWQFLFLPVLFRTSAKPKFFTKWQAYPGSPCKNETKSYKS